MKDSEMKAPSILGEWMLWWLLTAFLACMGVMVMAAASQIWGWSETERIAGCLVAVVLSGAWGVWGAMIWTRSRTLRVILVALALLPGAAIVAGSVWAFLYVPENRWVWKWGWLIVAGHGAGAIAMTLLLGLQGMFRQSTLEVRRRRLAIGWTVYPALIVLGSSLVVAALFMWMPDLVLHGDSSFKTLVRWVVPSQGLVLLTTALPAMAAMICRFLTRDRDVGGG